MLPLSPLPNPRPPPPHTHTDTADLTFGGISPPKEQRQRQQQQQQAGQQQQQGEGEGEAQAEVGALGLPPRTSLEVARRGSSAYSEMILQEIARQVGAPLCCVLCAGAVCLHCWGMGHWHCLHAMTGVQS
jgi:hypothetical protein